MTISTFSLIVPVLTSKDPVTPEIEDLNGEEAQSDREFILEYPSSVIAEIESIPDGMHLLEFPSHYEGAHCWCRPVIIRTDTELNINHKDLHKGEFDS